MPVVMFALAANITTGWGTPPFQGWVGYDRAQQEVYPQHHS